MEDAAIIISRGACGGIRFMGYRFHEPMRIQFCVRYDRVLYFSDYLSNHVVER